MIEVGQSHNSRMPALLYQKLENYDQGDMDIQCHTGFSYLTRMPFKTNKFTNLKMSANINFGDNKQGKGWFSPLLKTDPPTQHPSGAN